MCDRGAWESGQGERKREGEQLLRREVDCVRLAGSGAMKQECLQWQGLALPMLTAYRAVPTWKFHM